jgi:hypothetical protein
VRAWAEMHELLVNGSSCEYCQIDFLRELWWEVPETKLLWKMAPIFRNLAEAGSALLSGEYLSCRNYLHPSRHPEHQYHRAEEWLKYLHWSSNFTIRYKTDWGGIFTIQKWI